MQVLNVPVHAAIGFNHVFSRERNKVEYIGDFPDTQNAESISSIEVLYTRKLFSYIYIYM